MERLWIPGRLPGLNEIIEACGTRKRNWNAYTSMKREWGQRVSLFALAQGFKPGKKGYFTYLFVEANRKRDPSNIVGGGVKIIEDALQECCLIEGDGWIQVKGIAPFWCKDADNPGVSVFWDEGSCLTEFEARRLTEQARKDHGNEVRRVKRT